jgi:putative ABC transport system ATP-binding protein
VTKVFTTDEVETHALAGIELNVRKGEYISISGPSGCGKSTLLAILGLLDTPSDGSYVLNDTRVDQMKLSQRARVRNREIGFIFQAFNLIGDLTVYENVELPLTYRNMPATERKKLVKDALERVGMSHRIKHYPSQLSGGQQQRVAVARALAGRPSILLADEPTGNLDSVNGEAVMGLLSELHQEGATICMVTHDPRYARCADRIITLFDGRIIEETTQKAEQILSAAEALRVGTIRGIGAGGIGECDPRTNSNHARITAGFPSCVPGRKRQPSPTAASRSFSHFGLEDFTTLAFAGAPFRPTSNEIVTDAFSSSSTVAGNFVLMTTGRAAPSGRTNTARTACQSHKFRCVWKNTSSFTCTATGSPAFVPGLNCQWRMFSTALSSKPSPSGRSTCTSPGCPAASTTTASNTLPSSFASSASSEYSGLAFATTKGAMIPGPRRDTVSCGLGASWAAAVRHIKNARRGATLAAFTLLL